jgi:RimJ/RimL family protein N-acetyltransferase
VGEVGLYTIDWAVGEATIGIWQRQAACGRGFGHEGFVALTAEALDGLRLGAVEARVHPRNGRSRHLVERAGFELWGTAPGVLAREGTNGEMLVYRRCRGQGGQPSESG